ncbi:MAG: phosphoenolpyruvate synthase [Candidatus Paceibacterota bacterium]|jgi:pyruvate,water dikinase
MTKENKVQDNRDKEYILWFRDLSITDVPLVGGKNAALGEMVNNLTPLGVKVPDGFAITAYAYNYFLVKTDLKERIKETLEGLDTHNVVDLQKRGAHIRSMILKENLPADLETEILAAYHQMSEEFYQTKNCDVAVRSSATAEDLPGASFAGQQETYLNISGEKALLEAVKKCFASLFTNRAISYRVDKGFSMFDVLLSVGVQKMVRSDVGSSGVAFSIDTETGFKNVVVINSAYGLGEMVVQGQITPDEFVVFKPTLEKGYKAILSKTLGEKDQKMIYGKIGTTKVKVKKNDRIKFSLDDDEIIQLATWVTLIEKYFSKKHNRYQPMDIEWAKDGKTKELFIVQARPETIHAEADPNLYREYKLSKKGMELTRGIAIGSKIATGKVRIIKQTKEMSSFKPGEILVTEITDPDWEPIMKIASAIITEKGGRTSHAAIVSRELGVPCIVGTGNATKVLKNSQMVTVDCSSDKDGLVYKNEIPFKIIEHRLDKIPSPKTKVVLNVGSPEEAMKNYYLPVAGVGLGRLEFIITSYIKIHPKALLDFEKIKRSKDRSSQKVAKEIEALTEEYSGKNKKDFYVNELAEGISLIGAAFWPNEVIIRFSDFKTNEYRTLIGGEFYEPEEENPMIGWRGASRYYDPKFRDAFVLEVEALAKVRNELGLTNVVAMVPFCRTLAEGQAVIDIMAENGLDREKDKDLKIYVMCEVPSNVILVDKFLDIFDGMSIGSNDLTQLTLGLDRDSSILTHIGNENDPSVKDLISAVIERCRARGKYVGICGQAPSDYPEFAEFLVKNGITSMSLNPDVIIKMLSVVDKAEKMIEGGIKS